MDDLLKDFIIESSEFITGIDQSMVALEKNPSDKDGLNQIFRAIHSIKGACGVFGLARMEKVAHAAEDVLSKMRDGSLPVAPVTVGAVLRAIDIIKDILSGLEIENKEPEGDDSPTLASLRELLEIAAMGGARPAAPQAPAVQVPEAAPATAAAAVQAAPTPTPTPATAAPAPAPANDSKPRAQASLAETSLRVGVEILDSLMNLVGELVLTRNQLTQIVHLDEGSRYQTPIQALNRITSDLQEAVMKTRMQPVGSSWAKLPRIVRDVSIATGKTVELVMTGAETEIDRQILQELQDPLTHCIRNAIDHGIEKPDVRTAAGKSPSGTVNLSAWQEGGHIIIEVRDDGAGVDFERVRKKVVERGLAGSIEAEKLGEAELIRFLFEPGFSTAQKVTEVSGRGVGMDVVRSNVEKLGGTVELTSERGKGSVLQIHIPLTLAIVPALVVGVAGQSFAIPQISITELVRVSEQNRERIEKLHGARVLRLREQLLPLIELRSTLEMRPLDASSQPPAETFIVVTQVGDRQVGLIVDEVFDTQEIVVKPMGRLVRDLSVYSGTTILGDGRVIMILDAAGVANRARALRDSEKSKSDSRSTQREAAARASRMPLLLFKSGEGAPKAVPLALVSRLEEIPYDRIEQADGRFMVQYRDHLLPLVPAGEEHTENQAGVPCSVIVFSESGRSMGLWVREILDIVEGESPIERGSGKPGILGLTVVDGRVTEIIDTRHYLTSAHPDWFSANRSTGKAGASGRKPRILVADGSPFFRELLRPDLEAQGYEVCLEDNARGALKRIDEEGAFDVLLAGLDLDGLEGSDLAERVRRDGRNLKAALIALTDAAGEASAASAREAALRAGFDQCLNKFDRERLMDAIQQAMGDAA
jgi:two-component system chemotaxis sensor kinase CheA